MPWPGWHLASFALAVAGCVYVTLRQARHRREDLERAEREHGRGAALRVEAIYEIWNDARIERIAADLEALEGTDAAARLRTEVEQMRARTPLLSRPVRSPWAIPIALVFVLLIIAAMHVVYG